MRSLPRLLRKQKLSSSSRVSRSRVARSSSTMTHDYYEDHILYYLECPGSAIELIRARKEENHLEDGDKSGFMSEGRPVSNLNQHESTYGTTMEELGKIQALT